MSKRNRSICDAAAIERRRERERRRDRERWRNNPAHREQKRNYKRAKRGYDPDPRCTDCNVRVERKPGKQAPKRCPACKAARASERDREARARKRTVRPPRPRKAKHPVRQRTADVLDALAQFHRALAETHLERERHLRENARNARDVRHFVNVRTHDIYSHLFWDKMLDETRPMIDREVCDASSLGLDSASDLSAAAKAVVQAIRNVHRSLTGCGVPKDDVERRRRSFKRAVLSAEDRIECIRQELIALAHVNDSKRTNIYAIARALEEAQHRLWKL